MADTFDAGTVYAEARLDRDEFQRELQQLRRDMAAFERQQFTVGVSLDAKKLDADAKGVQGKVRQLNNEKANPKVGADTRSFFTEMFKVRNTLKQVSELVASPLILVEIGESLFRIAKLKYELRDMAQRYVIDVIVYPQAFQEINRISNSLLSMKNVARTAIPVLFPLLGAAAGGAAIVGSSLMAAGGAAGVFALAAVPALTSIVEKSKEIEDAQKKVSEALTDEQRKTALAELQQLMAGLSEQEKRAVQDVTAIKSAWQGFQTSIQPAVFGLLHQSVGLISALLPPLVPVVDAVAAVIGRWMAEMEKATAAQGFKDFVAWLAGPGVASFAVWGDALGNFVMGFVNMMMGASGATKPFEEGLLALSERFLAWSQTLEQNQQWQEFLRFTQAVMPDVLSILGQLIPILFQIHQTFAPITEAVLGFVAGFMQAHPELTKFIIVGFAVSQFLMGLVGLIAGVVLKILLFAAIMGRISAVFAIARTAQALWAAAMIGDFARVGTLAVSLFQQIMKLTVVGRIFTAIANATKIWAIAQAALNLVMSANPIFLIIAAIALLVGALVLAWQHSETFRNIVMACWEGIKTAAMWAWENGIKPAVDAIVTAWNWLITKAQELGAFLGGIWQTIAGAFTTAWNGVVTAVQAVGQAFQWLWTNILQPVFSFIDTAARVLVAVLVTIVLTPIILLVKLLGLAFMEVYNNAIKPAWDGIVAAAQWAWGILSGVFNTVVSFLAGVFSAAWNGLVSVVSAVWSAITSAVSAAWGVVSGIFNAIVAFLAGVFAAAWNGFMAVVQVVWSAIQTAISVAWGVIQAVWGLIVAYLGGPLAAGFNIFQGVAQAVWSAIQTAINVAWGVIQTIWGAIVAYLGGPLSTAFNVARDLISSVWQGIQSVLSTVWNFIRDNIFEPLRTFVMDTIPNAFRTAVDGIRGAWDAIREAVASPIRFMVNLVYNEGIVPAWNFVAGLVDLPPLAKVNLGFAKGGVMPGSVLPGYSPGVDNYTFWDPMSKTRLDLSGGEAIMRPEVTRAFGKNWVDQLNYVARTGGVGGLKQFMRTGGETHRDFAYAAGGVVAGQAFAQSQAGKPYVWGGVGPGGYDCSGFISAVTNVVLGLAAHSRRFATGSFGPNAGAGGFVPGTGSQFVIGVSPNTGSGIGHMSGNLGGMGIESRGGDGVVVGGGARSPVDGMFPWQFYLPQVGGQFVDNGGAASLLSQLMDLWKKVEEFLGRIGEFTNTLWGQGAMEAVKKVASSTLDFLTSKLTFGLFDQGGVIQPGLNLVNNKTGKPELAGRVDQWAKLIDSARVNNPTQVERTFDSMTLERLASTMSEVKELLERRGAGAQVVVEDRSGDPVATGRQAALAIRMS